MARQSVFPFAPSHASGVRGRRLDRSRRNPKAKGKRTLAPRVSPAAVRVPDPRQLSIAMAFPAGHPQIFVHEGARQSLERRLAQASLRPVLLSVTDNRRSMISYSERDGVLRARVHHMFLGAPASVQDALVRYIVQRDRAASNVVGRYIDLNGHRIRAVQPVLAPLTTQGKHHDLLALYRSINEKYFDGAHDALITWGRRGRGAMRGKPRRSIKLGSYSAVERLIRIHPVLDRAWIPRYFLSYIIYHEMLHHVIPSDGSARSAGAGRRVLHSAAFLARERMFRDFERAIAWERAHIRRLLIAR